MSAVSPDTRSNRANPVPLSDEHLIKLAQEGDRAGFDELVRRHYTLAHNVAYRMLSDHDLAADATQGAFVRAYKAIGRFRHDASFSTWLYRIVTNVCLDHLRQHERTARSLTLLDDDDESGLQEMDIPDASADPAGTAEQRARQDVVQQALSRLGVEHRQILVMYDLTGQSYEDISEMLAIPLGTVKSRLNRARHALKAELTEHMELFR